MSSKRESITFLQTLKVIAYAIVGFALGLGVIFTVGWFVYGLFSQQ